MPVQRMDRRALRGLGFLFWVVSIQDALYYTTCRGFESIPTLPSVGP